MLVYVSHGPRRYDRAPVGVTRRRWWEFQAVLRGRCWPVLAPGQPPPGDGAGRRLWVFPPGTAHGWCSGPGPCEIAVFHFDEPPAAFCEIVGDRPLVTASLDRKEARALGELARTLAAHQRRPDTHTALHEQAALAQLARLAVRELPARPLPVGTRWRNKVDEAIAWFTEHLHERPGVAEVARGVHVSPAHLRRLFHQARGAPPMAVLRGVQVQRARQLMVTTDAPLESIARACGFSGPSVFSRVFARLTGEAPRDFRRRV